MEAGNGNGKGKCIGKHTTGGDSSQRYGKATGCKGTGMQMANLRR